MDSIYLSVLSAQNKSRWNGQGGIAFGLPRPLAPGLAICFSVFQSQKPERTLVTCRPPVSCILAWSVECDVRHIIAIN